MNNLDAVDVLLVEDDPYDAELTVRALQERNLANHLYVVEDGAEALDFIFCRGQYADRQMTYPPKVVLLDIRLPRLNGLEVLREIKADERTHSIPVVMITSSREDPDVRTAYELGANSYVVKPVEFDAFMEAMNHLGFFWLVVNQVSK
jgi:two-component system response regulator